MRCDPPISGPRNKALIDIKNDTRWRQQDATGHVVTLELDLRNREFAQAGVPTEIQQIPEPAKGEILRAFCII